RPRGPLTGPLHRSRSEAARARARSRRAPRPPPCARGRPSPDGSAGAGPRPAQLGYHGALVPPREEGMNGSSPQAPNRPQRAAEAPAIAPPPSSAPRTASRSRPASLPEETPPPLIFVDSPRPHPLEVAPTASSPIAQLVERVTVNHHVPGSSPGRGAPEKPANREIGSRAFLTLRHCDRDSHLSAVRLPPSRWS